MKFEMDLVAENHKLFGVPIRDKFPDGKNPVTDEERALRRRLIREETDETINEGLLASSLVKLADGIADSMVVTAGTLVQYGLDPTEEDFIHAAKELIEDARGALDKGLMFRQASNIKVGAVMLQLVCYGIAYTLNIPYHDVFKEVHRNNMAKVGPDGKPIFDAGGKFLKPKGHKPPDIEGILQRAGLLKGAANDA